eukprot:1033041-Prorocentrum_minimum.AAC.1
MLAAAAAAVPDAEGCSPAGRRLAAALLLAPVPAAVVDAEAGALVVDRLAAALPLAGHALRVEW